MRRALLVIAALLCFALPSRATISIVAHTSVVGNGASVTVTTLNINTTGATAEFIGVIDYNADPSNTPPSDSLGNTWTYIATATAPANAGGATVRSGIFYCLNPTTGTAQNFSVTSIYGPVFVIAASGVATSAALDLHSEAGAGGYTSSTVQPGGITPSQNGEILITLLDGGTFGTPYTIDSSFTNPDSQAYTSGLSFGGSMGYLIQTTAGVEDPTWSATTQPNVFGLGTNIASFKASGGPPPSGHCGACDLSMLLHLR